MKERIQTSEEKNKSWSGGKGVQEQKNDLMIKCSEDLMN